MTGTETTKCFADRLQDLISESGKDVKTLAAEIGVSSGALSKYQNDKGEPGITALYKIAAYFDVTADYLIGLSDNKTVENSDVGARFGFNDGAITELLHFKKVDDCRKSRDSLRKFTELDVLNRLLEYGDLQRICYLISSLTLNRVNLLKNINEVAKIRLAHIEENKRLNKSYNPQDDLFLPEIKDIEFTETDYFKYQCWCISRDLEQLTEELVNHIFDSWMKVGALNANNPETR